MSIQHMQMVFDAGNLTAPQKAVLLAYCNFTDAHGYCWPGVERIADMTGLSASGVKKVRKQLIESELLKTVSRGKKGGGRTTNASRINVKRLQSMKRPERTYDDNVMDGLGFEEDVTEQSEGTPQGPNGSPEDQQRYLEGTNEGSPGTPYPSVDPSADPSSSSVALEDITHDVVPEQTKKKTSKPQDREQAKTLIGEHFPDSTDDEREAIIDLVYAEAAAKGVKIGFIATYIGGRPAALLEQDLAQVRRHSAAPTVTHCGIHQAEMKPYGCEACAAEIKAGDHEDLTRLRAHLALVGEKARPDLARLLGAPVAHAGATTGGWSWEHQHRAERRHRNGVVGGTRHGVGTQATYDTMAQMSQDELRALMLG